MADKTALTELEALQLEEARAQATDRSNRRIALKKRVQAIEETIRRDKFNREYLQSACAHRKGGRGLENLYNGNDQNFSLVTHRLSVGGAIVICQRCGKLWQQPKPLAKDASPQQKEKYREEMTEFRRVRTLPTDNQPSGSTLFTFASAEEG